MKSISVFIWLSSGTGDTLRAEKYAFRDSDDKKCLGIELILLITLVNTDALCDITHNTDCEIEDLKEICPNLKVATGHTLTFQ